MVLQHICLLVCNIISFLDDIQLELQNLTKINLQTLDKHQNLKLEEIADKDVTNVAIVIKCKTSQSGYTLMCELLIQNANMKLPTVC